MTAWEGSTRRGRLPADWPLRRRRILKRDSYRCQIAGPRCTTRATEVDHIVANDDHGDHNLRAVCAPCHATKSGQEGAAARPRINRPTERHPGLLDPHGGKASRSAARPAGSSAAYASNAIRAIPVLS